MLSTDKHGSYKNPENDVWKRSRMQKSSVINNNIIWDWQIYIGKLVEQRVISQRSKTVFDVDEKFDENKWCQVELVDEIGVKR